MSLPLLLFAVLLSVTFASLCTDVCAETPPPVITFVTGNGCGTQQNGSVFNCAPPLILSIQGDQFKRWETLTHIEGVKCNGYYGTSTALNCAVSEQDNPLPTDVLLPISLVDLQTGQVYTSPPRFALSAPVVLRIDSVSGCSDVGATTTGCEVSSTSSQSLTLTGRGFNATAYTGPRVLYTTPTGFDGIFYNPTLLDGSLTVPLRWLGTLSGSGNLTLVVLHGTQVSNPVTVTFLPNSTNSAPDRTQPPTLSSIVIHSVSGCVDSAGDGTTRECLRPMLLTISGSGFPVNGVGLLVTVAGERCTGVRVSSNTSSPIVCSMAAYSSQRLTGVLLPVQVFDLSYQRASAPFPAVSFAPLLIPVISSISGCTSVAGGLQQCDATDASVTLTGTGFTDGDATRPWSFRWGLYFLPVTSAVFSPAGDSVVLRLNQSDESAVSAEEFAQATSVQAGAPLLLYVQHGEFISTTVPLSFTPPATTVTAISGTTCSSATDVQITNCDPGTAVLTLYGDYLVGALTVQVGGLPCTTAYSIGLALSCLLPVFEELQPGLAYDLTVQRAGVTIVTLPAAVSYSSTPFISSITSRYCPHDFTAQAGSPTFLLNCDAAAVLTISGNFWTQTDTFSVSIRGGTALRPVATCDNVQLLTTTAITCVLPALNSSQVALLATPALSSVRVLDATTNSSSNALSVGLYRNPSLGPLVSTISGCAAADPNTRGVQGCVTGAVITVHGQNLSPLTPSGGVAVHIFDGELSVVYPCLLVSVRPDNSSLTCALPYIPHSSDEALVLPLRVMSAGRGYSNWFVGLGYSSTLQPATPSVCSSSSSYQAAFIACLVLLLLTSLVIAVLLLLMCRLRRVQGKQMPRPMADVSGQSYREFSSSKGGARLAVELA